MTEFSIYLQIKYWAKLGVLEAELKLYRRKGKSYYISGYWFHIQKAVELFHGLACSVGKTCGINLMASGRI